MTSDAATGQLSADDCRWDDLASTQRARVAYEAAQRDQRMYL